MHGFNVRVAGRDRPSAGSGHIFDGTTRLAAQLLVEGLPEAEVEILNTAIIPCGIRRGATWIRRRGPALALLLVVGWAGFPARPAVAREPVPAAAEAGQRAVPPVIFVLVGEPARATAERCATALDQRGAWLAATLLPADQEADTIRCLLMGTAAFRSHFATRLPDWGVGAALPGGRAIAIDYERVPEIGRSVEEVFLHELTHALVHQAVNEIWLPVWFQEGVALWFSGEWRFLDTVQVVLDGNLPELGRLEGAFPAHAAGADQAYRTSLLAITSLRRWYGEDVLSRLLAATEREQDFQVAFRQVTGETLAGFTARFAGDMRLRFGWLIALTRWPTFFALLALLFAAGAVARLIRNRRRLAAMTDELDN
jgi:hypothetical protein